MTSKWGNLKPDGQIRKMLYFFHIFYLLKNTHANMRQPSSLSAEIKTLNGWVVRVWPSSVPALFQKDVLCWAWVASLLLACAAAQFQQYVVEQAGCRGTSQAASHTSMSRCDKIKQMNFRTHTMGSVTEEQFISIRDYVTLFFHSAMYIM